MPRSAGKLPSECDAVGRASHETEYWPESDTVSRCKERAVSHSSSESPQWSVLSTKQIVGEVQRTQHVKCTADNADKRERVPVNDHGKSANRPLPRTMNCAPRAHAMSCC